MHPTSSSLCGRTASVWARANPEHNDAVITMKNNDNVGQRV